MYRSAYRLIFASGRVSVMVAETKFCALSLAFKVYDEIPTNIYNVQKFPHGQYCVTSAR